MSQHEDALREKATWLQSLMSWPLCARLSRIAGRAAAVSKPMENVFFPIMGQRVDAGLPPFEALHLQRNPSSEVVKIAFSEIVRDDLGEKARRVWVEVGLAAAETRDEFLKRINQNIDLLFGSMGDRSDTLARRIRRINSAISEKVVTSDLPAGSELSHQLRILYTVHLSEDGPEDRRLRHEAALELMASLTDVVRLSFAATSDPNSYLIAQDLRNWWRPSVHLSLLQRSPGPRSGRLGDERSDGVDVPLRHAGISSDV